MILVSSRMVYATETYVDIDTFDNKTAIIFAHQDDDLLWMLPFWGKSTYIVLGGMPTTSSYIGLIAAQQTFLNSQSPVIDYQSVWQHPWNPPITDQEYSRYYWHNDPSYAYLSSDYLVAFWNDGDATITRDQVDRIKEVIRPFVEDENISRIVTHNNWGEYNHQHHRAVNQACRELAVEYEKDVWVLGSKVIAGTYHDLDPCDVPYTIGYFPESLFFPIRSIYLNTTIYDWSAWTGGTLDPTAEPHRFLKVVDQGNDLSASSDCLRQAYFDVLGPDTLVSGDFDGNHQTDFAATDRNQSIWVRTASTWTKLPGGLDVIVTGDSIRMG